MVQADRRTLPYGIYADNIAVLGIADISGSYVAWTWHYAGCQWSTEDCAAVRFGFKCESKYDERGSRYNNGSQSDTKCGEGSLKEKIWIFLKK